MKEEFYLEYSKIFQRQYCKKDTVKIINTKQAGLYIKHGIPLMDLFWSDGNLVFVFSKEESKNAYLLWCERKLK